MPVCETTCEWLCVACYCEQSKEIRERTPTKLRAAVLAFLSCLTLNAIMIPLHLISARVKVSNRPASTCGTWFILPCCLYHVGDGQAGGDTCSEESSDHGLWGISRRLPVPLSSSHASSVADSGRQYMSYLCFVVQCCTLLQYFSERLCGMYFTYASCCACDHK